MEIVQVICFTTFCRPLNFMPMYNTQCCQIQIFQTNLHTFPQRTGQENFFLDFFPPGDHFVNSHIFS